MFSRFKITMVAIFIASLSHVSNAASDVKFAFVDMQKLESDSVVVSDLINQLQKEQQKLQSDINAKSKELQEKARDLESKRAVLSATSIEEKRKALENNLITFQSKAQKRNEDLQSAKSEALADIDEKVKEIISDISKKKKYDMVLAYQVLMYVKNGEFDDITNDVLDKVNKSYKSIDLSKYLSGNTSSKSRK